jgi:lipopolysaccharide transport system permease protein
MLETDDLLLAQPHPTLSPPMADRSMPSHAAVDDLSARVIFPRTGWIRIDWRELFAYRELLLYLVIRDVSVRYKQTVLGTAWAIIQPVSMMLVFTVVFGSIANLPSDGFPYPVFVFAGLIPWTLFSQGFAKAAASLALEEHLMSKVYFPRIFLPIAGIAVFLVDQVISLGLYALLLLYYRVVPSWTVIFVPLLVALTFIATMSLGLMFASLMVFYRDFRYFLPFLSQFILFVTPVIYPLSMIKNPTHRWVLSLNPMFGIVPAFRSAILGVDWDLTCLAISAATALLTCTFAVFYFRRTEHQFVDFV